jgi:hypothetical protein
MGVSHDVFDYTCSIILVPKAVAAVGRCDGGCWYCNCKGTVSFAETAAMVVPAVGVRN